MGGVGRAGESSTEEMPGWEGLKSLAGRRGWAQGVEKTASTAFLAQNRQRPNYSGLEKM